MRLTLVRHAPAADPEGRGREADAERPLTRRGRHRAREVRQALKRAHLGFDGLRFSPARRAVETAARLRALVDGESGPEPLLARAPGPALLAALEGERPLLVGHQPHLAALAAWLVFGQRALGAAIDLKKAGVLVLEGEPRPRGMRLVALLPPGALARWART